MTTVIVLGDRASTIHNAWELDLIVPTVQPFGSRPFASIATRGCADPGPHEQSSNFR